MSPRTSFVDRGLRLALVVSLAPAAMSCGGGTSPATSPAAASASVAPSASASSASSPSVAAARAPLPVVGLPAHAALVGALDARAFDEARAFTKSTPPELVVLLASLKLDDRRPITFALASLGDADRAIVDEAKRVPPRQAGGPSPARRSALDALAERLRRRGDAAATRLRVIVPSLDPRASLASLERQYADRRGTRREGDVLTMHVAHNLLRISAAEGALVIDAGAPDGAPPKDGWFAADAPTEPAPELAGQRLRVVVRSEAAAQVGVLLDLARTVGALASVDASQQAAIFEEGAFESAQLFELSSNVNGVYFQRAELTVGENLRSAALRLSPGPGFAKSSSAAFESSPSLSLAGADWVVDASSAWKAAWPQPGGSGAGTMRMLRDAGAPGYLQLGVMLGLLDLLEGPSSLPWTPEVVSTFSRLIVGQLDGGSRVFAGVYPPGIQPFRCISHEKVCTKEHRVEKDKVTVFDKKAYRLVTIGDRQAMIAGARNRVGDLAFTRVDAPALHVSGSVEFDASKMIGEASLRRDGDDFAFEGRLR
jgi:hypothetical protein